MKQVICECGRIAEVRRRSNGKHLRYRVCKKCGPALGGIESARALEDQERDDIGVYGEFPGGDVASLDPGAGMDPVAGDKVDKEIHGGDWEPDAETMPDYSDVVPETKHDALPEKPGMLRYVGWVLIAVGVGGLGLGATRVLSGGKV
ncbi:hypothetical protein [Teredinibacter turnerae]|uniref:hypothetical protein n=1 Tax=Teredinibacter turnerae TaxID=2426 RepID=UPI000381FE55|nr:hypothetical protein [Teredinibacter turnerae]